MPQVDIVTFFDITFWTALIYVVGFVFLNLKGGALPMFFDVFKVTIKRLEHACRRVVRARRQLSVVQLFPWIII